jgi:hypothetical protein
MRNYIKKFDELAKEVESNQLLELTEFEKKIPLSKQDLEDIKANLKTDLDDSILEFYHQMNGLTLIWRIKPDLAKDEREFRKTRDRYNDYYINWPEDETEENPFAKINLLPLEYCLAKRDWQDIIVPLPEETVEFENATYKHSEFVKLLKPFDLFSDYKCMAFFMEAGNLEPKVVMLSDYYIEWDESRITNFESYLEMLLATKGIVESRARVYGEHDGHKQPLLITPEKYWIDHQEYIPKLFQV